MAFEIEKNNLAINQIIANKEEQVTIEGDCIVPDVKPDVINIVSTSGVVSVYKKEVSEGKVRIDGAVSIYILYNGNNENKTEIRSINHILDFSQVIAVENATSEMNDFGTVTLNSINCHMINERKINIKSDLNFSIMLSTTTNTEYVNNIKLGDLQKMEEKKRIDSIVGIGQTKTRITENIAIDNTDNLSEILKMNTTICNVDTKVSYNKVLVKSDIIVKILYSTEDGRINLANKTFPVMGFIDMKDVTEDNIIKSNIEIINAVVKPNGTQDHSISIDFEIGIQICVYNNKEISIIEDMYSPSINLKFTKKQVKALQNTHIYKGIYNLNQKEFVEIGDEKVYDIDSNVFITEKKVIDNALLFSGEMIFSIIHSTNKMSGIDSKSIKVPFDYKMTCDGINNEATTSIKTDIKNENYNILPGGEIELRADIEFTVNSSNISNINLIEKVEEDKEINNNNYNVVIYYTNSEDNLWKIAKKFRSTKELIIKENKLENENIKPGTQLFITRYTG